MKIGSRIVRLSALGLLSLLASQVYAAGYKLEFQSASVLADAGEAAVVEDAGTNWYNSAGLVYLPLQVVMSGIDVYAPTTFSGTVTAPSTLNLTPFAATANNFTASGSASSHPNSILPAFHLSAPLSQRLAVGFSMVPSWGFTEDYGEGSILRYNLTRVYTKTIELTPSLAFKVNPQWSIGLGPDFNYFSAESKTHVRTEGTLAPLIGTSGDSISRFSGDNWSAGGHIGVLYRYSDATRIGINYRSKLSMHLSGYSQFRFGGNPVMQTDGFRLAIPLPPVTTLSIYHDVNPCWALMGTVAYDQWSSIQNYTAINYIQPSLANPAVSTLTNVTAPQDMHNTLDFGVGTHYKLNEKLMLRANVKYEPTPTKSAYRYVNFPDGVKLGVQIGARYQATKKVALDVIYGHVFVRTMHINDFNPASFALASGHSRTSVDLLGGQLVWDL
jgi:long-chain fatty acid transport protein